MADRLFHRGWGGIDFDSVFQQTQGEFMAQIGDWMTSDQLQAYLSQAAELAGGVKSELTDSSEVHVVDPGILEVMEDKQ